VLCAGLERSQTTAKVPQPSRAELNVDCEGIRLSARKEGTSFALGLRRVGHVVWVRGKEVTPVKLRVLRSVESEEGSWDRMDI